MPGSEEEKSNKRSFPLWAKLLATTALVFLASIGYLRSFDNSNPDVFGQGGSANLPSDEKRKSTPDIILTSSGSNNAKLSDFRGKVVLLSFWASWCTPCLVELPTFIELYEKLSDKGLVILPLNVDEPDVAAQFVKDFWKTKNFPFATYYDPDKKASELFNINTLPSNFVLDKKGRIVAQGSGANDWASDDSIGFIQQLLDE